MLDFFNLIPKLFLYLQLFTQSTVHTLGKETVSGYAHTFSDCRGINLSVLSVFPTDEQINQVAKGAYNEAKNLIFILGVSPNLLTDLPANIPLSTPTTNNNNSVKKLQKSTLSSNHQDQMKDLSYASIMLSVHQDIEM